jgi:DNA gyrase subunit A
MAAQDRIQPRGIENEMKTAYIDYSMSVIVSRALPDVRDGLKPVHRRVLYGMSQLGLASNRPHKKSARIVGEVLGKYHPHGDGAVYDTMVRMAQDWSLRYPLVDGQGNYGSVDGDPPAAMRYTEARLRALAEDLLEDIDKNTVDFAPNFDDSTTEPTVLPARVPNLLINGASGIAVGMATNMAPHNLREVVNGIVAYIDNRDIAIDALMKHVTAPDFPTGGIIYGIEGVKEAFRTGRGRIVLRGKSNIETDKGGRERIIVTEIPYQVNKAVLVEKIAELRDTKKIEGIGDVRDESDREGYRVVIEIKKDALGSVVLNNLYKHTALQVSFNVNNVALVNGRPMLLNLKDLIRHFVDHRHEVVIRRTQYELDEAQQRAHILEGLLIALDNLDAVIALIRGSRTPDEARTALMRESGFASQTLRAYLSRTDLGEAAQQLLPGPNGNYRLTEMQAKAILDMRLQRLTGLEIEKVQNEHLDLLKKIAWYKEVLGKEELRMQIIKDELQEATKRFGDERRTQIEYAADEINMEDLIAAEEMVITITRQGYIKRTSLSEYRVQKRGGVGLRGSGTKDEDFVEHIYVANTHNYLLLFTEKGKCFWLKVYEIPEGARAGKGRAIQNLIQIEPDDTVRAYINVPSLTDAEVLKTYSIIMCTERGVVKKTALEAYSRPRQSGINAISINEADKLMGASLCTDKSEIVIATSYGRANRFNADKVRDMGRTATGVRGIRLTEGGDEETDAAENGEEVKPENIKSDNKVVGMVVVNSPDVQLLVVSEKGYGKRSSIEEYRKTARGTQGVITMNITDKTGLMVAIVEVTDKNDLMIITQEGLTIRTPVKDIRVMGRNAQGVRLIRLRDEDGIAAVAKLEESEGDVTDATTPPDGPDTSDSSTPQDE